MLTAYRDRLVSLAESGVYLGTSSWKYPGWCGLVYDEARYQVRGRFSEAAFKRDCLAEYAETFTAVGVDLTFYDWPKDHMVAQWIEQTPDTFRFAFKVTDAITVKQFSRHPRYGSRAGQDNPDFLDAELFREAFLAPLVPLQDRLGAIVFEFGAFYPGQFSRGRDFVEALDAFLGAVPSGPHYAVEIRNRTFLHPDYFACLAKHRVAHVFNAWTRMPPIGEQLALPDSAKGSCVVARALLRPGRTYQDAVEAFAPYDRVQQALPEVRRDVARVASTALERQVPAYLFINNRAEGCAPMTVGGILDLLGEGKSVQSNLPRSRRAEERASPGTRNKRTAP